MKNFIKNKFFVIGFFIGFGLFVLTTNYIDKINRPICFDCSQKFGFPFYYLETGGQAFSERYILFGLIGNILIAIIFSFILGLTFKFVWSKIAVRKLR